MKVLPFQAIRAAKPYIKAFSASVYDKEAKKSAWNLNKDNPYSFFHIKRPAVFKENKDLTKEESFKYSTEKLNEFIREEVLIQEDVPAFYIYRQKKKDNVYKGIIALVSVEEYQALKIKKHELTVAEKQKEMSDYMRNVGVSGNPVLLTYAHEKAIDSFIDERMLSRPEYNFTGEEDGTEHQLWVVDNEKEIAELVSDFNRVKDFYIADGHHRCASANLLYPGVKSLMACLIPDNQLIIHGFHRVLTHLNGVRSKALLEQLEKTFIVKKVKEYQPGHQSGKIGLFLKDNWYEIQIPEKLRQNANPKHNLDVYILDQLIFKEILGIENTRTADSIEYVNGETDLKTLISPVKEGKAKAVFVLNPMTIQDVICVSDYNETMPPKSTWIEPKMRSGLLINRF